MRKLGIVIAITAAATLGFTGHASANGHEGQICPAIDGATQAVVDGGFEAPESQDGLVESCVKSNMDAGLVAGPLICGITADMTGTPLEPVGTTLDEVREGAEQGGANAAPLNLTGCGPTTDPDPDPDPKGDDGDNGGGGGGGTPTVQAANAAPDGGLPRTGGELFAGAGFALMSLGALVRRFLP